MRAMADDRVGSRVDRPARETAEELGWMKRVVSPAPMLKLCHSMAARCEAWFTVSVLPLCVTVALPPTTIGLTGLA